MNLEMKERKNEKKEKYLYFVMVSFFFHLNFNKRINATPTFAGKRIQNPFKYMKPKSNKFKHLFEHKIQIQRLPIKS